MNSMLISSTGKTVVEVRCDAFSRQVLSRGRKVAIPRMAKDFHVVLQDRSQAYQPLHLGVEEVTKA